jgi:hypothetical protein
MKIAAGSRAGLSRKERPVMYHNNSQPLIGDPADGFGPYPEGWTADEIAFRGFGAQVDADAEPEGMPPNVETRSAAAPEFDLETDRAALAKAFDDLNAAIEADRVTTRRARRWLR